MRRHDKGMHMSVLLWAITMVLCLPTLVLSATYYASPSGGGAASCVDNAANVCTIARAITVSSSGDTVVAACGTYDLGSSALAVNKNISIAPLTPAAQSVESCGIITSSNATSTVDLTASNDSNTLTFGGFEVLNTGGAGQIVRIVSAAYDATVVLNGTYVPTGGTNRHIQDLWVRGVLQLTNCILGGTLGAQAGVYSVVTPTSAKSLTISGLTGALTASATNTPIVYVERAAGVSVVETVEVADSVVSVTVPSGLGASAVGVGVRFNRIDNALAQRNTITVTTLSATAADALGLVVSSTDATATANSAVFKGNTVTCLGPSTRCVSIGTDSVTTFNASGARVTGNTVINSYYDGAATSHGIHCGRVVGCFIGSNTVRGFSASVLSSMGTGTIVAGNLIIGGSYAPLFAKGNTSATFANNTVIMDDSLYGARFGAYGCLGVAVQGATNNAATSFINNNCYVKSGSNWKYAVVDNSQVASFDHNNYYSIPTLTTPWSYQSTTYATLTLWNAAAPVVTDLETNPLFVGANDFRTQGSSPLRRAGLAGVACIDVRGRPCWQSPDIGAYQATSGDAAATRATR